MISAAYFYILQARSRVQSEAKYVISKLNFVDLAGSERLGKTKVFNLIIPS